VVVRGGGEMATAAARLLFLAGFPVVVAERAHPLAVRRLVAFAEAVRLGRCTVEGVDAVCVGLAEARDLALRGPVAVVVEEDGARLATLAPAVVVDARMRKAPAERLTDALHVGLGPGFKAGEDVDAVIETQRGPELGRVIWSGLAQVDTAVPAEVLGVTIDRVLRAPRSGKFHSTLAIGDLVEAGQEVGRVGGEVVQTKIAGLLRGLVANGVRLAAGEKLGDVDPRGPRIDPALVSEKARAVAAGVLEAVCSGLARC
jgi:xanthine dehydrogenase accessory factor